MSDSDRCVCPSPHRDSPLVRIEAKWLVPVVIWIGTRTRTEPSLACALQPCGRVDTWLWEAPVGDIVTNEFGRAPCDSRLFVVEPTGLRRISRDEAFDLLDPPGAEDRAAQRAHDALADAEGLPRTLSRFVGDHGLRDGVHRVENSHYFAERCTRRQAYWRRASRAEVAAFEAGRT